MFEQFNKITTHELSSMTTVEFDALLFGLIRLDHDGVVRAYNAWEAQMARHDPRKVIGRNFFTEIAPCTNVAGFRGKLDELIHSAYKSHVFDYEFAFPWGTRNVRVRFVVESDDERWVLITGIG